MSKKPDFALHLPSLQAVQRYIDQTPRTWQANESVGVKPSTQWDLNAGMDGALVLARDGWKLGSAKLATGLARLPALKGLPDWQHDVAGYLVDMGAFCAGRPDCMLRPTDEADSDQKPALTLAVNIGMNAITGAEEASRYGLAIARYVDEMEAMGNRVEVIAAMSTQGQGQRICHSWTVKSMDGAMSLEDIAFSLGHPAACRRFEFALCERLPKYIREFPGYGSAVRVVETDIQNAPQGLVVLNGMEAAHVTCRDDNSAVEAVRNEIETAIAVLDKA